MNEKGLTNKKIAERLGVSVSTVTHWSNGRRFPQNDETIKKLLKVLQVESNELFEDTISDKKPVRKIPVVGTASCGLPEVSILDSDDEYCYYSGEDYNQDMYALIACGDSMAPEVENGDKVVCDPHAQVQTGDIVHYQVGNENAIKIYVRDEDAYIVQFIPYNTSEEFKTTTIRLDDDLAQELKVSKVVGIFGTNVKNRKARLKFIGRG
jgi:SOS-response transcriptional repressor LexA